MKILSVNLTELSKGNISSSMVLTAPISGYIGRINANTGAYAEPNKMLFEIIDNSKIHCDLLVYEKDIFKVKVGQKIHFVITNMPEHQGEHDGKAMEGEIFGINKSFEDNTKAVSVHAIIKNENHELIPGMYVSAFIDIGENKTTVVPSEAVFTTDGKEFIFIRNKMTGCKKHPFVCCTRILCPFRKLPRTSRLRTT
ncbi:MAG: efflux RND transporter periplasmic adaptor subunit [Saprospiraceae bacterium]|nr:efflux RND transporter periplasmic adaptor subunit [Saprospiraceae bacterium]